MSNTPFVSDSPDNREEDDSATMVIDTTATEAAPVTDTTAENVNKPQFTDDSSRQTAASEQRQAAAEYTAEAAHNGYPTGGSTPPQTAPYAAYPGWNGASSNANTATRYQKTIVLRDKTGPNAPTIVWGAIVTVAGLLGMCVILFGDMFARGTWVSAGAICILALGVILIVCAIASGVKGGEKNEGNGRDTAPTA